MEPITSLSCSQIAQQLRQLGLAHSDIVEVHSSLSSLGYVAGGAATVIQALIAVVGETGAIVMSAYPVTLPLPLTEEERALGILAKVRFLDPEDRLTRTGMGAISDRFRDWPGTCLGTVFHRVCAWGKDADRYCKEGYAYLLEQNGWGLLIGVDINRLSSMHQAEGKAPLPPTLRQSLRTPAAILARYPTDQWYVDYRDPQRPLAVGAWDKVFQEADRRGLVIHGQVGQATCYLFRARPVVAIYEDWLERDPYGLFGFTSPSVNPHPRP